MPRRPIPSIGFLVCVAIIATSLAIAEVQLRFAPETRYPAGNRAAFVAIGDFDGDGRQDLAVANANTEQWFQNGDVSILRGNGDGSFAPQTRYPANPGPVSLAIADLDSNGRQDIVVANYAQDPDGYPYGGCSVLLGNGDGSFSAATLILWTDGSNSVSVGDFDGDGHQDLGVTEWGQQISVLLGNGDGSFASETRYPVGPQPNSVTIGDFDSDGHQDIAVANWESGDISVLLGNGDGGFAPETRYPVYFWPTSLAMGDFEGDGRQDLVTTTEWGSDVVVLLGNGDGSFAPWTRYPGEPGTIARHVATGDFDGDGHQDLAVAHRVESFPWTGGVSVLPGNGDGTFAVPITYPVGENPSSIAVGDFDRDGRQDLAVSNWGSDWRPDSVSVLLNRSVFLAQIDIMSGSINPYGRGSIPVAILGSEEFNVADIDVATLRFGTNEAPTKHDLTDPFDYNEHLEDVNLDGFMDLMLHFKTQETGIVCGDTEATLKGSLLDGTVIVGTDSIQTVGCNSNRPHRGMTSRGFERMQREQSQLNSEEQQAPGDLVEDERVD